MEIRKPRLTTGKRIAVGLGFAAIGVLGVTASAAEAYQTAHTKTLEWSAVLNGDTARAEVLDEQLRQQQEVMVGDVISGATGVMVGATLLRRRQVAPHQIPETPALVGSPINSPHIAA